MNPAPPVTMMRRMSDLTSSSSLLLVKHVAQVAAVVAAAVPLDQRLELRAIDEAEAIRDLLDTADLEALPLLDDLHERRGLEQRVVRARVEPRIATGQHVRVQLALAQVRLVDVRDLELA